MGVIFHDMFQKVCQDVLPAAVSHKAVGTYIYCRFVLLEAEGCHGSAFPCHVLRETGGGFSAYIMQAGTGKYTKVSVLLTCARMCVCVFMRVHACICLE